MNGIGNTLTKLFLSALVVTSASTLQAQTKHFIYIQSDTKEPFYLIMNHKIYESSSIGYLIMSNLTDGDYNFTIGFPKDKYPQQAFACTIDGNDAGYSLKLQGNTWSMVNIQSHEELNAAKAETSEDGNSVSKKSTDDSFSGMLSQVSGGHTVVNNTTTKTKKVVSSAVTEVPTVSQNAIDSAESSLDDVYSESQTYSIVKKNESTNALGTSMTFVEYEGDKEKDTINTFIPAYNLSSTTANEKVESSVASNSGSNNPFYKGNSSSNSEAKNATIESSDEENSAKNVLTDTKESKTNDEGSKKADKHLPLLTNEDIDQSTSADNTVAGCDNPLTSKEVDKIRKKMISKASDEDMIAIVRKAVDTKCITTDQTKSLGNLLLSDDGRLNFYRQMYSHVSDKSNFASLQSQILDPSLKSQFKSLIQ